MIRCCSKLRPSVGRNYNQLKLVRSFSSFQEGDRVRVEWGGSHWDAEISEFEKDKVLVKYSNWSEHWDEWLPTESTRIQPLNDRSHGENNTKKTRKSDRLREPRLVPQPEVAEIEEARGSKSVIEIEIGGVKRLCSSLSNGRLLFKDWNTGRVSWDFPLPPRVEPLAEGFVRAKDLDGKSYYFNTVSGKCQYSLPTVPAEKAALNSKNAKAVTAPWEVLFSADGTPYYHNVETGAVSWTPDSNKNDSVGERPYEKNNSVEGRPSEKKSLLEAKENEWEVHYTEEGFPFYHSKVTGESVWEVPQEKNENWWESSHS